MAKVVFKFAALMNPTEKYPNGYCKTVEIVFNTNKDHFLYNSRWTPKSVVKYLNRKYNNTKEIKELGYTYSMCQY